ncbi:hypothetical protein [Flocculibacter collagenilyticus]|uniref:hypothetical protein n=1 Tax=Flocculibacter collagenilyticus TaxID=2744479 RepID=UPI0018F2D09C|nr:hypothetical protein [Flocculibacter collagenilyticus]
MRKWTSSVTVFAITILISANAHATPKNTISKQQCLGLDHKIEQIRAEFRAGYTAKRGETLRSKLKKLQEHRFKCKSKRYPTH